ncbi:hypothetical protein, partial [Alistipes onderdonkii]|uniref:hypothetical protein n=1 Tax=Alistipes onderdonkii TaxID=328813 RepID=UPI0032EF78F0
MQPLAGILRKRRRHVVVGREADPEIPGGKVGGRDASREHKAATVTQFLQIRVTRFRWVLSIPFFISCIRQQNPLTVLSK